MKNFGFDYSEYSRKTWAISHICCLMDDVLRRIIYMLFYDNETLNKIKKGSYSIRDRTQFE